jgi:hypothetical protein
VAAVRLLGELYNYKVVSSQVRGWAQPGKMAACLSDIHPLSDSQQYMGWWRSTRHTAGCVIHNQLQVIFATLHLILAYGHEAGTPPDVSR